MSFKKLFAVAISSWILTFSVNALEIKIGHVGEPNSLFNDSAEHFVKLANSKLGSKAKVVNFGSSQLGSDKEMMQKVKLGTL
ncbi:MAG: TRAP transporter substrate-binding protein, partial [Candidatus Fonsibacter sp.]